MIVDFIHNECNCFNISNTSCIAICLLSQFISLFTSRESSKIFFLVLYFIENVNIAALL